MSNGRSSGAGSDRKSLLAFGRDDAVGVTERPASRSAWDVGEERLDLYRAAKSRRSARQNEVLAALRATEKAAYAETSADTHDVEFDQGTDDEHEAPIEKPAKLDGRTSEPTLVEEPTSPPPPPRAGRREPVQNDPGNAIDQAYQPWVPLIDPLKVIGGVFDSKMLIVVATLIGAGFGVATALNTPKKYEAVTELLIDPRDLKLSERDLTEQGLPSDATLAIVENQVRIITSGAVLNKVVDRLNLTADDEFNGTRRSFGVREFISELRSLLTRSGDSGTSEDRVRSISINNLAKSLHVERSGKTFIVTVGVTTENAEKSALIANTMTDVFLQAYGSIQSDTAGRAADELNARLDELRASLEAAERKVATFKAENDIVDPQGRPITDDEIVKLNDQLSVARARTLELNAKAASVRGVDVDSALGGALPEGMASGVITELRAQYAALKQESDKVAVRLGPRHPERQAIDAQMAGAREQIAVELRRVAASVQVELKRAVELEQQLAQRLAQLKVRQGDISEQLVDLRELERDATAKRAVYESYLLRAKETGEQSGVNTANMSVLTRAYAPLDPVGPGRMTIALGGALLGFASGVGLGLMRGVYAGFRERRWGAAQMQVVELEDPQPDPDLNGGGSRVSSRFTLKGAMWQSRPAASAAAASAQGESTSFQETQTGKDSTMLHRNHDPYAQGAVDPYAPAPAWSHAPTAQGAFYGAPSPAYPPQHAAYPHQYAPQPYPPVPPAYLQQPHAPAPMQAPQAPAYAGQAYPGQAYAQQAYPQHAYPQQNHAPQQWSAAPVAAPPMPQPYPQQPQYAYAPQAAAYAPMDAGYAPQHPHYGAPQAPAGAQPIAFPGRHAVQPQPMQQGDPRNQEMSAIDEIRASLAEFRDAVRDFTDSRQKRRIF